MKIAFRVHKSPEIYYYNLRMTLKMKKKNFRKMFFPPCEKTGKIRRCTRPGSDPAENT
jgi:hypothetical protein